MAYNPAMLTTTAAMTAIKITGSAVFHALVSQLNGWNRYGSRGLSLNSDPMAPWSRRRAGDVNVSSRSVGEVCGG